MRACRSLHPFTCPPGLETRKEAHDPAWEATKLSLTSYSPTSTRGHNEQTKERSLQASIKTVDKQLLWLYKHLRRSRPPPGCWAMEHPSPGHPLLYKTFRDNPQKTPSKLPSPVPLPWKSASELEYINVNPRLHRWVLWSCHPQWGMWNLHTPPGWTQHLKFITCWISIVQVLRGAHRSTGNCQSYQHQSPPHVSCCLPDWHQIRHPELAAPHWAAKTRHTSPTELSFSLSARAAHEGLCSGSLHTAACQLTREQRNSRSLTTVWSSRWFKFHACSSLWLETSPRPPSSCPVKMCTCTYI